MTDSSRRSPAVSSVASLTPEYAVLPVHAPELVRQNTISVRSPQKIQSVVEAERRRNFQLLVRRYTNQLLYGCQREYCDTATCYTARKRLPRISNAGRRLTLLSARILACHLAAQDDPEKALCPGRPVVPALSSETSGTTSRDSSFREEILDDGEEKENKVVQPRRPPPPRNAPGEVEAVTDKGLKDSRSFTQQLFNTVAVKMVEWIGLPPPSSSLRFAPDGEVPKEPPKLQFATHPMDIIDTGPIIDKNRQTRDSEAVSQSQHQVILQQPPRKRGLSLSGVITPTPHSNPKTKLSTTPAGIAMPPPPPPLHHHHHAQRRTSTGHMQVTPSRKEKPEKHTHTLLETPEVLAPPQCLKRLDRELVEALVTMCRDTKVPSSARRDAEEFARQSIFYVFSTHSALLESFGGIGQGKGVGYDPRAVDAAFELLVKNGWGDLVKRSLWLGLAKAFTKPGKGLSDRDTAALLLLGLHALAAVLRKDEKAFLLSTEMRARGRVAEGDTVSPEIGLDDEMAERLMKRVLRAITIRSRRPGDKVVEFWNEYLEKCGALIKEEQTSAVVEEYGESLAGHVVPDRYVGWSLARCTLEWTRSIFLRTWDGEEAVQLTTPATQQGATKDGRIDYTLAGACLSLFELLYTHHERYALDPCLFETPIFSERINYRTAPLEWFQAASAKKDDKQLHLLDSPYLFTLDSRVTFFRSINMELMRRAYETSIAHIRMAQQMAATSELSTPQYQTMITKIDTALSVYCVVAVRRTHLLEDAVNQLVRREKRELQRPLKVRFVDGEEGIDQGGVTQEFFVLLLQEILKPDYGIFRTDERTRKSWFNEACIEGDMVLELLGVVLGLAVYNGVTVPVNFPRVLYHKLLGQEPGLDDIGDAWPELQRGLKEMLEWNDGDVSDIFCRTYEYSYEVFGEIRNVNMLKAKERGETSLPRQVPRLKRKLKMEAEWSLPDPWMGGLDEILDQVMQPLEREQMREREAIERSQRAQSSERGYTVSYTNLADVLDEASSDARIGTAEEANRRDEAEEEGAGLFRATQEAGSWEGVNVQWSGEVGLEATEEERGRPEDPTASSSLSVPTNDTLEAPGERKQSSSAESWETMNREDDEAARSSEDRGNWEDYRRIAHEVDVASHCATASTGVPEEAADVDEEEDGQVVGESTADGEPTDSGSGTAAATPLPPSRSTSPSSVPSRSPTPASSAALPPSSATIPTSLSHSGFSDFEPSQTQAEEREAEDEEAPLVTNATREDFVADYVRWLTTYSIAHLYTPFSRGFFSIFPPGASHLRLFTPSSLQCLLEGASSDIDIDDLERHARYEDGYHANHHTIKDFWAIVRKFSPEEKRRLLTFVTSVDRVPVGGMQNLGFWIVRNGGPETERVPSSLTCFGRLLLPEYSGKRKMREKLKIALDNITGFGTA